MAASMTRTVPGLRAIATIMGVCSPKAVGTGASPVPAQPAGRVGGGGYDQGGGHRQQHHAAAVEEGRVLVGAPNKQGRHHQACCAHGIDQPARARVTCTRKALLGHTMASAAPTRRPRACVSLPA